MNIPTTRKLSDAERFCEGLRMIARECNMTQVKYNNYGVVKYIFEDGSEVGSKGALREAGLIKNI